MPFLPQQGDLRQIGQVFGHAAGFRQFFANRVGGFEMPFGCLQVALGQRDLAENVI